MKHLISGIDLTLRRKDGLIIFSSATILLFLLVLVIQNGHGALLAFSFESLSKYAQWKLFFSTFFNVRDMFTFGLLVLATVGSIVGGLNMALAYVYWRVRGEVIMKSNVYHGVGLLFAFLGVGCAACGTAVLSVILSIVGLSSILSYLPYQGLEVGFVGLLFLMIATYTLARKITEPMVC